jgi:predicted PurR-regulated permease PerM
MNAELNAVRRIVYLAAGIFVALWFAQQVLQVILLIFLAIVFAIVLNAPVTWLQAKKIPRTIAALIVFFSVLIVFGFFAWLIIPKLITQVQLLIQNLPVYIDNLSKRISNWLGHYNQIKEKLEPGSGNLSLQLPSTTAILTGIGQYSISVAGTLLWIIFFFCMVVYMLINPGPLLEIYISFFPEEKRQKAAQAFARASVMTIGWMWSNIVAGIIRAIIVWFFLYFMGIPGVWVWAGVTFFAELIPKIGFYLMAVPPILIALSINPLLALWTAIFYIGLDEIMGDFVIPRIRSTTMHIHPVSILVILLAMTSAFGLLGAFIATPLTAFIKAYYEEFYLKKLPKEKTEKQIDLMIYRKPSE